MYLCKRHEALISPTLKSLLFQRRQFRLNGVKTLLWKLLRKLLHYLPKITLQYWTIISLFYLLTCITSFWYLSITCNAFIACYIICDGIFKKPKNWSLYWYNWCLNAKNNITFCFHFECFLTFCFRLFP